MVQIRLLKYSCFLQAATIFKLNETSMSVHCCPEIAEDQRRDIHSRRADAAFVPEVNYLSGLIKSCHGN
jgi:hypothetical protein